MSKLKNILLNESILDKPVSSKSALTYGEVKSVLEKNAKDGQLNSVELASAATELNVTVVTLTKYIGELAKAGEMAVSGTGKNFKATFDGSNPTEDDGKEIGTKNSGTVSQANSAKTIKFNVPKVTSGNAFFTQVEKVLKIMNGQSKTNGIKNSLMLSGDPGTGKTSFIRNFSKLLGLPLVTVEAPHITEEHIVNIPFLILNGDKVVAKDSDDLQIENFKSENEFDVVQAESHLVTKLKNIAMYKLSDSDLLEKVRQDKNLAPAFVKFKMTSHSSEQSIIDNIRDNYNCILFLDEYYRQENKTIRNILRNILNGRIGNDRIPRGVYIVYASNLTGQGVTDIPTNNDFAEMQFDTPDRDQWFSYIYNKYENNNNKEFPQVTLQHSVYNAFEKLITQDDLSHNSGDVRTSPRRWEQLLLYVNANIPAKDVKHARALLTNVYANFRDYLSEEMSDLWPKVSKAVTDLIAETSGVNISAKDINSPVDWRDTFQNQIETKIKLGDARKYVPIVSGPPGIGKTANMEQIADKLDMHFLHIDVSSITDPTFVAGLPVSETKKDANGNNELDKFGKQKISTKFSKPEFLLLIEKLIDEEEAKEKEFPEDQRKKGSGKYKYILLLDELTRTSVPVFNALRQVLLEHKFNETYDVPEDIMIISALNPTDVGVTELTEHTKDVTDIIPGKPSWKQTESYLMSKAHPAGINESIGFDLNLSTVSALKIIIDRFRTKGEDSDGNKISIDESHFYLKLDGDVFYVSPREYTDIVAMANSSIADKLLHVGILPTEVDQDDLDSLFDIMAQNNGKLVDAEANKKKGTYNPSVAYSDEDFEVFIDAMVDEFRDVVTSKLSFTMKKQQLEPENFVAQAGHFIRTDKELRTLFEGIKVKKVEAVKTLREIFEAFAENPEEMEDSPYLDAYLKENRLSPNKLASDVMEYFTNRLSEISAIDKEKMTKGPSGNTISVVAEQTLNLTILLFTYINITLESMVSAAEFGDKATTGQYVTYLAEVVKQLRQKLVVNVFKYMEPSKTETYDTRTEIPKALAPKIRANFMKLGIDISQN